jgi:hypothetical protein
MYRSLTDALQADIVDVEELLTRCGKWEKGGEGYGSHPHHNA